MSNQAKYDQVISSQATKIAVIAGPGSGKTKGILIPKAKSLIEEGVDPKHILLLSFSRPSAIDLKDRVKSLDKVPRAATIHSYCLSFLLSEDNHDIRQRIDSILLDFEKEVLICDLKLLFPAKKKRDLKKLLDEFSAGWATDPHDQVFNEPEDKRRFKTAVVNWLDEHQAAMMEEIVYHAVHLAKKITSSRYIDEPQYIFVDEFQDLNNLEQEFIELLGLKSKLVLVVGDPDQSIYSFKYAHPEGITMLAERTDVEKHSLEYTGRCSKKIVDIANQILQQIDPLKENLLLPLPDKEDGEVSIISSGNQFQEFATILQSINEKIASGATAQDILILVPKKKLGKYFSDYANAQKSVPYQFRLTTKTEFTQLEQERLLLLGILVKPTAALHIRAYLGMPDSNYYAKEIKVLKEKYGDIMNAFSKSNPGDFTARHVKMALLYTRIVELREFIDRHKQSKNPKEIVDELFPAEIDGLNDIRKQMLILVNDDDSLANLYNKFLEYLKTVTTTDDQIRIMTITASKGLDADHVYILGCNDGNLPGENRSTYLSNHQFKQEQRRLLYVAVTRAKKSVMISWSRLIPFEQSKGNHTGSTGAARLPNGKLMSRVSISEFIQDLH